MKTKAITIIALSLAIVCLSPGCKKDILPDSMEWSVLNNPSAFSVAEDKTALVFELKGINTATDSYSLQWISIKHGSLTLKNISGADLNSIISVADSTQKSIGSGETAFIYLWVEPSAGQPVPGSLSLTIQYYRLSDGEQFTKEMDVPVVALVQPVLTFPMRTRRFATVGAPSEDSYHRRTISAVDGKYYAPQRYAMDLIGMDNGNRYRQGRQNANVDFYGFDDIIYSATSGEIVSVIDTIADNVPPKVPSPDPLALYRAGGNQVVVKAAAGVYVFYGHLKKASVNVKPGDRIEAGQPIARIGNSGNSVAPRLHLQVTDGPDPIRSNGIPWVFDHFIFHGSITGYDHVNGLIGVDYLTIQKALSARNLKGDGVISFD
jgi:murein DD-endopeptidase MepM/ murein hydrolase activator NlpD